MDPTASLVAALERGGFDPRETGPDSWESRCPSHDGSKHNLSVRRGDDGRALVHCHHQPGCSWQSIIQTLGMTETELFAPEHGRGRFSGNGKAKPDRRAHRTPEAALVRPIRDYGPPSAYWSYQCAEGSESFRVYRFDFTSPRDGTPDKSYRPVHPTPDGWVCGDPPEPLVLYRLPELADATRVYLTEGEKAADMAQQLGLKATTSAHGAKSTAKSDWRPLAGLEVVILPDHDPEGEGYADAVLGHLTRLLPRPLVKIVRLSDLWRTNVPIPEGGDIEEWLSNGVPERWDDLDCRHELERLADAAREEDLGRRSAPEAVCEPASPSAPLEWPETPKPVRYELRPVPPLHPEMIPEPFRGWLVDIAERVSCPLDFPAVGALVGLSIVVGRKVAIRPKRNDDWTVVANLWGAVIGRPGLMKTTALNEPMKPVRRLEAQARERHAAALASFQADSLVASVQADAAMKALKAAAKANQDEALLRTLAGNARQASEPVAPILRRYTTSDPSVEALGELLRDNPHGIGLVRDELTGWLRSFDKDGRECDRAFYLEGWNGIGIPFTYDRIGRGTILIPSPCVSILGGMQPGPLRSLLRRAARGEEADDGLVNRFQLLVYPDPSPEWRNVDRWPDTVLKNRAFAIFQALDSLDPSNIGAHPDADEGPPFLRFDADSQDLFDSWRGDLEGKLRRAEDPPLVESHLAKYRSLMPSLALLFHLIEVAGGAGNSPVTLHAAQLAIEWCVYLEAHARRIYACVADTDLEPARALSDRIKAGVLPSPFAYRHVYRRGWTNLDTPEAAKHAVAILEDLGWVRAIETKETGGAPRVDVRIHPRLPRKDSSES